MQNKERKWYRDKRKTQINTVSKDTKKDGVKDGVKLTVNQEKIINKIKKMPSSTAKELSADIKINKRNVEKNLVKLQKLKLIKRTGSDKTGHWEIIE